MLMYIGQEVFIQNKFRGKDCNNKKKDYWFTKMTLLVTIKTIKRDEYLVLTPPLVNMDLPAKVIWKGNTYDVTSACVPANNGNKRKFTMKLVENEHEEEDLHKKWARDAQNVDEFVNFMYELINEKEEDK